MFSHVKGKANPRGLKGFIPSLISDEAGFIFPILHLPSMGIQIFFHSQVLIQKKPGLKLIDINM